MKELKQYSNFYDLFDEKFETPEAWRDWHTQLTRLVNLLGQSLWYHTSTWWVTEYKYLQAETVIKQAKHTYQSGFFPEKEKRKIETPQWKIKMLQGWAHMRKRPHPLLLPTYILLWKQKLWSFFTVSTSPYTILFSPFNSKQSRGI